MKLTKELAELRIARAVFEAEEAANELANQIAKLQSIMLEARRDLQLPRRAGQAALLRLAKANGQAIAAATSLHCVHGELLKTRQQIENLADQNGDCPWPNTVGEIDSPSIAV